MRLRGVIPFFILLILLESCNIGGEPGSLDAESGAPVIQGLCTEPDEIHLEEEVSLRCIAEDPDSDPLYYVWSVEDGELGPYHRQASTTWTAPSTTGSVMAWIEVTDLEHTVRDSLVLQVETPEAPQILSVTPDPAVVLFR